MFLPCWTSLSVGSFIITHQFGRQMEGYYWRHIMPTLHYTLKHTEAEKQKLPRKPLEQKQRMESKRVV